MASVKNSSISVKDVSSVMRVAFAGMRVSDNNVCRAYIKSSLGRGEHTKRPKRGSKIGSTEFAKRDVAYAQ